MKIEAGKPKQASKTSSFGVKSTYSKKKYLTKLKITPEQRRNAEDYRRFMSSQPTE